MAIKEGTDVRLTWDPEDDANGFNTYVVTGKDLIPTANEPGIGPDCIRICEDTEPLECVHTDGILPAPGTTLYYNVIGVCNGTEATE